jgi:hypothetical protein
MIILHMRKTNRENDLVTKNNCNLCEALCHEIVEMQRCISLSLKTYLYVCPTINFFQQKLIFCALRALGLRNHQPDLWPSTWHD